MPGITRPSLMSFGSVVMGAKKEFGLAEIPKNSGDDSPCCGGGEQDHPEAEIEGSLPDDQPEDEEAHATEFGALGIKARRFAATARAMHAELVFSLDLMFLNQGGAGGENSWKGEKQATHHRPVVLRNDSGDCGNGAAEEKTDGVLVPSGLTKSSEIQSHSHSIKKKSGSATRAQSPAREQLTRTLPRAPVRSYASAAR